MSKKRTTARDPRGGAYESRGSFLMRVTTGPRTRTPKVLPWCSSLGDALQRASETQVLVNRLRAASQTDFIESLVKSAAVADAEKMASLSRAVDVIVNEHLEKLPITSGPHPNTFRTVLERWTSGELALQFPDHVARKRSAKMDEYRATHIPDVAMNLPIGQWRAETYESVMSGLDPTLSSSSRRQVAQVMHRVLQLAVYPLRLIPSNPIVRGMLPRVANHKELAALFPDDALRIARCEGVDLGYRVLWSFLAENGWRISEAVGDERKGTQPLRWRDVRFEHGFARLLRTKTGGAVKVPLDATVLEGLRAWQSISPRPKPEDRVFVSTDGLPIALVYPAETFRQHLKAAGLKRADRPELFPEGDELKTTKPVRVHELRSLFVCSRLAHGATDTWVRQRTGHRTPGMLDTYRRQQHIYETLAPITPMVEAVPELAAAAVELAANAAAVPRNPASDADVNARHQKGFRRRDSNSDKRIQNSSRSRTLAGFQGKTASFEDEGGRSEHLQPSSAAATGARGSDAVEAALASAIEGATRAGEWLVVGQLARELETRRMARAGNVVALNAPRRRDGER